MPPVVLALGFDLFFRPKLSEAAKAAGVEVSFNVADVARASRIVADASAPGALAQVLSLRATHPNVPVLACYPHVQADLAEAVVKAGGSVVTRGKFNAKLTDMLVGPLPEPSSFLGDGSNE